MSIVPIFDVNLDLPPEERWTHIIQKYKYKFNNILKYIDGMLGPYIGYIVTSLLEYQSDSVYNNREIKAISKESGIPLGKLIIMQLCYETCACCTSIVINNKKKHIQYRTKDWEMAER